MNTKAIDEDVHEYYTERAAIGEYERGMDRREAEREASILALRYRDELIAAARSAQ